MQAGERKYPWPQTSASNLRLLSSQPCLRASLHFGRAPSCPDQPAVPTNLPCASPQTFSPFPPTTANSQYLFVPSSSFASSPDLKPPPCGSLPPPATARTLAIAPCPKLPSRWHLSPKATPMPSPLLTSVIFPTGSLHCFSSTSAASSRHLLTNLSNPPLLLLAFFLPFSISFWPPWSKAVKTEWLFNLPFYLLLCNLLSL